MTKPISLKALLDDNRITDVNGQALPEKVRYDILKDGNKYSILPEDVTLTFVGDNQIYPSKQLEAIVLTGDYKVIKDESFIRMGRTEYELNPNPLNEKAKYNSVFTVLRFK